jgi:hypothetical protein
MVRMVVNQYLLFFCILNIFNVSLLFYFNINQPMFKNLFKRKRKKKPICKHRNNFHILKTFTDSGIPYLNHKCYDCGYRFNGKVYVDPKQWKNKLICGENGSILIDKIPETITMSNLSFDNIIQ